MKQKLKVLLSVMILCSILTFTAYAQEVTLPDDSVWGIAWSPDSTRIAVGRYNGTVELRNHLSGELLSTLQSGNSSQILNVVWSPDGTKIAASNENKSVIIWNASNGQILRTLQGANSYNITNLAWSPDSAKVAGISQLDYLLQIWNVSTGTILVSRSHVQLGIDWFQDKLVVGSGNGIGILDSDDGSFVKDIGLHTSDIISVSWKPDGSQIASGSADGGVKIWSANPAQQQIDLIQPIYSFNLHTLPVYSVDWSPDGTRVASASLDGTINVWNAMTGQLLDTIQTNGPALPVEWSPDGTQLAYGGAGGTLHIISAPVVETPTPSLAPPTATPGAPTLLALLSPATCVRTCFIGIQPGITTLAEFKAILASRGITYRLNSMDGTEPNAAFEWRIPITGLGFTLGKETTTFVNTTFSNGVVRQMSFGLDIPIQTIIAAYGQPSQYDTIDNAYHMFYQQYGMIFEAVTTDSTEIINTVFLVDDNAMSGWLNSPPITPVTSCTEPTAICSVQTATPTP